jgi:ADP-ribose pyrophosphatase YjhB (NUDIX family)
LEEDMRRPLAFPVDYAQQGDREVTLTFNAVAIPPRHELVTSVHGLLFYGEELLLVRRRDGGWQLPGAQRRSHETFRETLVRTAWEGSGVLLKDLRLLGVAEAIADDHHGQDVWFLAEAETLFDFSDAFDHAERLLIDPGLAPRLLEQWSPRLQAILEYAQSIRAPMLVEAA